MTPLVALAAALLAGASPFQAEQPQVERGNERLLAKDGAAALEHYRAAEQEVGPHPEIDFDRGDALHALGRDAEALEAWKKAARPGAPDGLASRALQNTGNALDSAGDAAGARRAFEEALRRDPGNEDARYNLEVLQRRKPPPSDPQGQPGDGKQGAPPRPGQEPPSPRPAEQKEQKGQVGKPDAGGSPSGQRDDRRSPLDRQGKPQEGGQSPARPADLDRQDAQRLLDALRARERMMPLQRADRKDGRRRDVEKDW